MEGIGIFETFDIDISKLVFELELYAFSSCCELSWPVRGLTQIDGLGTASPEVLTLMVELLVLEVDTLFDATVLLHSLNRRSLHQSTYSRLDF
jgi:hypothetical protein